MLSKTQNLIRISFQMHQMQVWLQKTFNFSKKKQTFLSVVLWFKSNFLEKQPFYQNRSFPRKMIQEKKTSLPPKKINLRAYLLSNPHTHKHTKTISHQFPPFLGSEKMIRYFLKGNIKNNRQYVWCSLSKSSKISKISLNLLFIQSCHHLPAYLNLIFLYVRTKNKNRQAFIFQCKLTNILNNINRTLVTSGKIKSNNSLNKQDVKTISAMQIIWYIKIP